PSLKIRHNGVLGYFIEVPARHADRLMAADSGFTHRQTMAGAVRFNALALHEEASRIAEAGGHSLAAEEAHFEKLVGELAASRQAIAATAAALARIDVSAGQAERAAEGRWALPRIVAEPVLAIEGGRHPVVEAALAKAGERFVANDCTLVPEDRLWLVGGPNMGGKSTFLRQNALVVVLAQAGGFVPAASATIGLVDRLFSRVGASDNLARGRSTFMVEMVETAAILNQASARSLVILDEIGRGTATFDGLSIAWAAIEHLHGENRCRTLFATHFHELTGLAERLPRLSNATLKVTEWEGDVVFLHEVVPGAADRSYGLQVARLAGLPPAVVERAKTILAELERSDRERPKRALVDDLPLFAAPARAAPPPKRDPLRETLDGIEPDEMTPRDALEALYRLKRAAKEV
ncbi:MAG: DNA mismatch repair protein MutS, partial [Microvirga sp.]